MEQELMTLLIRTLIGILSIVSTYVLALFARYLKKKQEELIEKIGKEKYQQSYDFALGIFHLVEKNFKGLSDKADDKAKLFNDLLLAKYPYLTQEDIDGLRERVVGEFNREVKPLLKPVTFNSPIVNGEANGNPTEIKESLDEKIKTYQY